MFFSVLEGQNADAENINVSGRQRMLSQKIALYAHRLNQSEPSQQDRKILAQALQSFETNHRFLSFDNRPLSSALTRLYFDGEPSLDALVKQYVQATNSILNGSFSHAVMAHFSSGYTERLLQKLDAVVAQMEREAKQRVATLRSIEQAVWIITLVLLAWEARFIFYPMEVAIQQHIRQIRQRVEDIYKLETEKTTLEKLATQDPLTGLYSLHGARDFLSKYLETSQYHHHKLAVLFLDLDNFKPINDQYGHHSGDQVLVETAKRIKQELREQDVACRIGGDEFLLVIDQVSEVSQLEHLCERILNAIARPLTVQGANMVVSASIGCAIFPDHARNAEALKKLADAAMYQAKREGKNRYMIHGATVAGV